MSVLCDGNLYSKRRRVEGHAMCVSCGPLGVSWSHTICVKGASIVVEAELTHTLEIRDSQI